MQFLTSLMGASGNTILASVLALGFVLALIVLGLWVLKLFMKTSTALRPQGRRLQVVDQMQLDAKRQLLIVRRDNVEHLILTGGPQDLLVESGIPAAEKSASPFRRPQAPLAPDPDETHKPEQAASALADAVRPAAARPSMDRLREMARPGTLRKSPSLRHTGLLRPVSVSEPAVIPMPPMAGDNSGRGRADSATNPVGIDTNGRAALGAHVSFGEDSAADNR